MTRVDTAEERETKVEQLTTGYLKLGESRILEVVGLSMVMVSSNSPPTMYLQDRGSLLGAPSLLSATMSDFENWQVVALGAYLALGPGLVGTRLVVKREPEGLVIRQVRFGRTP